MAAFAIAAISDFLSAWMEIVLPLQLRRAETNLALFSTVTVFGTALDVTLAELAIEAFYPADDQTAATLSTHHQARH